MRWQEKVFGPMRERTLENAQLHLLATRYGLAARSRLGKAIIHKVNSVMDAEESRRGIRRVRTGELLLRTHHGFLTLPLRTGSYRDVVRRDILARCAHKYPRMCPRAMRGL